MIKEEMDMVRRDLAVANAFPDEEILNYMLRRVPSSEWPVYSATARARNDGVLQWVSPDNRAFTYRLAETRDLPDMNLVRDHAPSLEAFHLSRRAKNVSYGIALGLAGLALFSLLASAVVGITAPVSFVVCYILMSLSIEMGIVALFFLNKQRDVENLLWPLPRARRFTSGRELRDFAAQDARVNSSMLEAYHLARSSKYASFYIGLALIVGAFLTLVGLTLASKPPAVIFVPCYICLSLAVEAGLVGILFHNKMREIEKRVQPPFLAETALRHIEEIEFTQQALKGRL